MIMKYRPDKLLNFKFFDVFKPLTHNLVNCLWFGLPSYTTKIYRYCTKFKQGHDTYTAWLLVYTHKYHSCVHHYLQHNGPFPNLYKKSNFIYFTTITKQVIHTIYINHARWHRCLHLCGLPNLYTQSYKHIYVGLIQASSLHISQLCVDLKNKMSICHKICLYEIGI